jgi:plasmid stabilization system protein ParE
MTPVYWTPEAITRLEAIETYIANDAPIVAKEVIARLLGRSRQLESAPLSGRAVPEYPREDLRELLERPYRIIYRITDTRIEILSVMHYRQLLPRKAEALQKN